MEILESYSLREHNTFGIDAQADWFIPFASIEDLQLLSRDEYFQECRCITIGEGSNLLFLTNFHGIVLHSVIQSIERCAETADTVDLLVGSGVKWDDFVAQMAEPSSTASRTSPSSQAKSVLPLCRISGPMALRSARSSARCTRCIVVRARCVTSLSRSATTAIAIASSRSRAADYIVTHVLLRLSKHPHLKLDYADLRQRVEARTATPTARDVRDEVIRIRQEKLPDPKVLGNAGSFFMNPIISAEAFEPSS